MKPAPLLLLGTVAGWLNAAAPDPLLHVKVGTRDGQELCTNIWLPAARGRFPAVLYRTPYRKTDRLTPSLRLFRDAGYAVVLQDVRGRGHSSGNFRQLLQEENDTADTLTWMQRQPWFDGRAGLFGGSYPGIAAWRGALSQHPAIRAIAPSFSGGDEYFDRYYSAGGAFRSGHRLWWIAENFNLPGRKRPPFQDVMRHLPLRTADRFAAGQTLDFFQAAMDHPTYDAYWRALSTLQASARIQVPAHAAGGWFDPYCASDLEMFEVLRAAGRYVRLIVGPWGHNPSVPLETVPSAGAGNHLRNEEIAWFDAHVKGTGRAAEPLIRYYVMRANLWRETAHWPPADSEPSAFYLSGGPANSTQGEGRLEEKPARRAKPDEFRYDPADPVPTRGGSTCCNPRLLPWGPLEQADLAGRPDVLVFQTSPIKEPVEIAGDVRAVLWVKSSAPDTDFTAKLVDVAPDGEARLVCDGILRLRYRHGVERPAAYHAGRVERITVPLGPIAWMFGAGHRIRLDISSSNFPKYSRNLNTGRPIAQETASRPAKQTVFKGSSRPSHLVLPVRRDPVAEPAKPLARRIAGARNGSLR